MRFTDSHCDARSERHPSPRVTWIAGFRAAPACVSGECLSAALANLTSNLTSDRYGYGSFPLFPRARLALGHVDPVGLANARLDSSEGGTVNLEIRSEKVLALVDRDVEVEELGSGFMFCEGPVWNPEGAFLLFSDIAANTRRRWDERHGVSEAASPTNNANGMTLDADGRLLVCEHATSVVARMDSDGTGNGREVVASHYKTKELNSPNDIAVHSNGSIYFTDPPGGRSIPGLGIERACELDFNGVFCVQPSDLAVELVADDFDVPNGLCFSPDESHLYVNDTVRGHIRLLELRPDGSVGAERVFAEGIGNFDPILSLKEGGVVDGMKCDEHGNVWVTGPGGIWILSPDGEHLGIVRTPKSITNLHWGGPEWSWLFLTAQTSLYRLRVKVSGRREPFMATRSAPGA